jgi:hypothetical protein
MHAPSYRNASQDRREGAQPNTSEPSRAQHFRDDRAAADYLSIFADQDARPRGHVGEQSKHERADTDAEAKRTNTPTVGADAESPITP